MGLSQCGTASCGFEFRVRFIEHAQSRAQPHESTQPFASESLKVSLISDSKIAQTLIPNISMTIDASK